MKRILLGLGVVTLVALAVAWSRPQTARPEFAFHSEKLNPVTHLRLNNDPADFQFAIVSDRTGGHRARIFSRAVDQLNLLQPEFVVSVGDLIEGYTEDKDRLTREWREFQGYVARLQMPFFYVPGNHDLANKAMDALWRQKFGRSYYEFVYRGVLFVVLNTEDPPGRGAGQISAEQRAWLKKTLDTHKDARWTFVFLHKPMWILGDEDKGGWVEAEKLLAGRRYSVFAGHVHRYQKFTRHGMNYYMLATTGGVSNLRGVEQGEFDHIVWVTMKKGGPVIANVLLDGIVREDLAAIGSDEVGAPELYRRPTYQVPVRVLLNGQPVSGALVAFHGAGKEPRQPYADGTTDAAGRARLSTYGPHDGVPAGEYLVTVTLLRPEFTPEGRPGRNLLPPRYASPRVTPLEVVVKPGMTTELTLELKTK